VRQRPTERRVSVDKGAAHYLMRVVPYRAADKSIDGALLIFTNVTTLLAAKQEQRTASSG
jgi:two-component system CheB/CheR fusion protein